VIGEPGVTCVVQSSPDLSNWTPILTNSDFGPTRVITIDAPNDASYYRAVIPSFPIFGYALGARSNINLAAGTGLVTDSFNSMDTNSSTDGQYDAAKAGNHGDMANIYGYVSISSHTVNGSAFLGSTAGFTSSPSQLSGSLYFIGH
jgi:hypothetical protein